MRKAEGRLKDRDWNRYGRPTFVLTDDVKRLLDLTDLPDVDCVASIRLPYPTCLLTFKNRDETSVNLLVHDGRSGSYAAITCERVTPGKDYELSVWHPDGTNFTRLDTKTAYPEPTEFLTGIPVDDCGLAVKAFALITSRPEEIVPLGRTAKRRFIAKTDIPWCQVKRWLVGKTIRLPNDQDRHQTSDRTYRITSRFLVRGHWRLQAHGDAWSKRKLLWIMPFWKGPRDAEEALTRTYEVHSAVHASR